MNASCLLCKYLTPPSFDHCNLPRFSLLTIFLFCSSKMLCVTLDHLDVESTEELTGFEPGVADNLFVNYLSRIHRDEDFALILKGITRLLTNPLVQTYLPGKALPAADLHKRRQNFFSRTPFKCRDSSLCSRILQARSLLSRATRPVLENV